MTKEKLTKIVLGQDMQPCPECGSWDIKPQTPIKLDDESAVEDPKKLLSEWARKKSNGNDWLEGPCFLMCFECGHKGKAVDCYRRTATEVGQDQQVFSKMKELWNNS